MSDKIHKVFSYLTKNKDMNRLNKPMAIIGFIVVFFSAIFCPFLKAPLQANWNLYQVDMGLYMITNGLLGLAVLLFFMRKLRAFRIVGLVLVGWLVLAMGLVYFQIHNYFGWKLIDNILVKTLHMKWGWAVIIVGALIIIFSVGKGSVGKGNPIAERED